MDEVQAKFILASFRPNGADADHHDFAEALQLALKQPRLGEWLAEERAMDSRFADALADVPLPGSLREDILQCLAGARSGVPRAEDPLDAALVGRIATIHPPDALRERILAAMERTAHPETTRPRQVTRFAVPLAAAAGVALAWILTGTREESAPASAESRPLPVDVVQAGFIRTFESPLFSFDEQRDDHTVLIEHLESRKLPCPGCLPPGLVEIKGVGCRELVIDGHRGSIVCFDEPLNGTLHLITFRREDVAGDLPPRDRPSFARKSHWAIARWEDDRHVFLLIGNTHIEKLAALF